MKTSKLEGLRERRRRIIAGDGNDKIIYIIPISGWPS